MSQVTRRPQAILDLIEAADYLSGDNPAAADRFLDAAEESFADLLRFPRMGKTREASNPLLSGLRQWHVRGYEKYLIFYLVTPDEGAGEGIEVVRVLFGMRDLDRVLAGES